MICTEIFELGLLTSSTPSMRSAAGHAGMHPLGHVVHIRDVWSLFWVWVDAHVHQLPQLQRQKRQPASGNHSGRTVTRNTLWTAIDLQGKCSAKCLFGWKYMWPLSMTLQLVEGSKKHIHWWVLMSSMEHSPWSEALQWSYDLSKKFNQKTEVMKDSKF